MSLFGEKRDDKDLRSVLSSITTYRCLNPIHWFRISLTVKGKDFVRKVAISCPYQSTRINRWRTDKEHISKNNVMRLIQTLRIVDTFGYVLQSIHCTTHVLSQIFVRRFHDQIQCE